MILYSCNPKNYSVTVEATLEDGRLRILKHTIDDKLEDIIGDSDSEQFYDFSLEATSKLFMLLGNEESDLSPLQLIAKHFSGKDGIARLINYCREHDISYTSFMY